MSTVLVTMPALETHRSVLEEAASGATVIYASNPDDDLIAQAEVIVGNLPIGRLQNAPKLRLLQLNSAGVGDYALLLRDHPDLLLANASGAYGLAISEHMFGVMLGLMKRLFAYRDQQQSGAWNDLGSVQGVYGSNVLVIGLGDIGGEFARRCKAFGAHITGITRSKRECPDYCDKIATTDALDELLPGADIVFMSVPETKETIGLLSEARIAMLRKNAIVLNAGRGTAIDTDALTRALQSDRIGGAGLDVTDPEPLPSDHPLWQCPNCLITPHISGGYHLKETHDRIIQIAACNIQAVMRGEPIRNRVRLERGY